MKPFLVLLLLTSLAFAGCTDDSIDSGVKDADSIDAAEGDGRSEELLNADSIVEAPEWALGDYFGHHVFFGDGDNAGTHIDSVIVDESGDDWILKSNNKDASKWEATWDMPMLGAISKDGLETTAFTSDWNIYDFPLTDGKQWTANFNPLLRGARDLTLTATFDNQLQTERQGSMVGYKIIGINEAGAVELMTDYIPEIGWYSEVIYVDRTTNPDATDDEFVIQIYAMGQGSDWTGTIIEATADEKLLFTGCVAPPAQSEPAALSTYCYDGSSAQQPPHYETFTVSEEAAEIYGIYFILAISGQSRMDLIEASETPGNGVRHSNEVQSNSPEDAESEQDFYELVNPPAGEWTMKWTGAGFVVVGHSQLWEIQYSEIEFGA
jgi:hypothetical protein